MTAPEKRGGEREAQIQLQKKKKGRGEEG